MKSIFNKMNVNKKFLITCAFIFIASIGNLIATLMLLNKADLQIDSYFANTYISIESQFMIRDAVNSINQSLQNIASGVDSSSVDADLSAIKSSDETIDSEIVKMTNLPDSKEFADEFLSSYSKIEQSVDTVYEFSKSGNHEQAISIYNDTITPAFKEINNSLQEIGNTTVAKTQSTINLYNSLRSKAIMFCSIIVVICLSFTAYMFVVLRNSIVVPLKKLVNSCTDLENGNQIKPLHINSKDEFGELALSFEQMSNNIEFIIDDTCQLLSKGAAKNLDARTNDESKYVGKYKELVKSTYAIFSDISADMKLTNDIAEQVSAGSDQISAVSQTLSQGTTEQASAIEELLATVTNIAELSKRNAEEASKASAMSIDASQGVDVSNNYMIKMLEAMDEITATSKEIGKIVKAIDDIAFQTNILSLNAAVEAARAGDSGKGFAVVASEVRNLAQRSAEAAQNTTALVDSTVVAIETGKKIADATAQSLKLVEEKASFVSDVITKIAEASENQALATEQVLQGIDQVSVVVQTNSATAEESAASAEELAAQARILTEMTGQYKLFSSENL